MRKAQRSHSQSDARSVVTLERLSHGRLKLTPTQIVDALGTIGRPWKSQTMLERLEERDAITPAMHDAGVEFHRVFEWAAMHPIQTSDLLREIRTQNDVTNHLSERARHLRDEALECVGGPTSPGYSCAWNVLGEEQSLRDWAMTRGWNGGTIREEVAKGILITTLGVLAAYYRTA